MENSVKRRDFLRHLASASICLGLVFLPEGLGELMSYNRQAILAGEWWRLWSGHFAHFTLMHAWTNCALLFLLTVALGRIGSWRLVLGLFVIGPFAISLALMILVPEMVSYRGTSALAALFLTVCAGHVFERARGMSVFFLGMLLIVWSAKLFLEVRDGTSFSNLPTGVHAAWQAHIAGILMGIAVYAAMKRKGMGTHASDSCSGTASLGTPRHERMRENRLLKDKSEEGEIECNAIDVF